LADEGLGAEPIVKISGVDMGKQDKAGCIDEYVTLPASSPLCSVVAARPATDARRARSGCR
jgi:hypothetical protein